MNNIDQLMIEKFLQKISQANLENVLTNSIYQPEIQLLIADSSLALMAVNYFESVFSLGALRSTQ